MKAVRTTGAVLDVLRGKSETLISTHISSSSIKGKYKIMDINLLDYEHIKTNSLNC